MKYKVLLFFVVLSITSLRASKTDTFMVVSKSMNKTIANSVITPDSYGTQKECFSVLYLLHGASGNYKDWTTKALGIEAYADKYNIIIVCPDGGLNSWYFDSPIDSTMRYETYISKELIEAVDKAYNTRAKKNGRAITGLSMGGHGAFYLAFKHPDIYGAAGSMSGGMDIRQFPNNWDIAKQLGTYAKFPEHWENNTVINMVHLLNGKGLKLIFDCGLDDFFYDANKRLHEKLIQGNIPHEYIERPGNHNWNYWSNAIKYQLKFFNDYFKLLKKN